MSFSMYDLSVPILIRGFGILTNYLDAASVYAFDRGIDPATVVHWRLAPDMLTFAGQVQRASDNAKGAIGRLAGVEIPSYRDDESTFDELQDRVSVTVSFLRSIRREQLDGSENRVIELKFRSISGRLRGDVYLVSVLLPNFFFHIATAHAILRNNGLNIGKKDYLGDVSELLIDPTP